LILNADFIQQVPENKLLLIQFYLLDSDVSENKYQNEIKRGISFGSAPIY
jgi:hypothetical protein